MSPILPVRVGTSGAALVVRMCALQLRKQWLSRNLCDTSCPALPPDSISPSSLLAHCDSSMAAISGAPFNRNPSQKALHALQQLSPQSDLYSHLILACVCACLTVFVLPTSYLVGVVCCCGWATRLRSKRPVSCVLLPPGCPGLRLPSTSNTMVSNTTSAHCP